MKLTSRKHWTVGHYATIIEDSDGDLCIKLRGQDFIIGNNLDEAIALLDEMFRDLGEALGYEISAEEG